MPCQDAQNRRQAAFFLGWQRSKFFDHHASLALLNCPVSISHHDCCSNLDDMIQHRNLLVQFDEYLTLQAVVD